MVVPEAAISSLFTKLSPEMAGFCRALRRSLEGLTASSWSGKEFWSSCVCQVLQIGQGIRFLLFLGAQS